MLKNKIEFVKRGAFDELYTLKEAVACILPFIPKNVKTIWECTAIDQSEITKVLRENGYKVVTSHINNGLDFFDFEPKEYDMIITNPPYSLKDAFLQRAFELNKPL